MADDRTHRLRHDDLEGVVDRLPVMSADHGAARRLVHVYDGGALAGTKGFVLTNPVDVVGDDREGGAASYSVDLLQTIPVLVGTQPQAGDILRAHHASSRWMTSDVIGRCSGVYTFTLVGCAGNYPGATTQGVTVDVYDLPGGNKLGTGVLDQNGQIKLSITYPTLKLTSPILTDGSLPFFVNSLGNGTPELLRVGMVLWIGSEYLQITAIDPTGTVVATRGFQDLTIGMLKHETWDETTPAPPTMPTGWSFRQGGFARTATPADSVTPFSPPNLLQFSAAGDSKHCAGEWQIAPSTAPCAMVTFAVADTTDDQAIGVFLAADNDPFDVGGQDQYFMFPSTPFTPATVAPTAGGTTGGNLAAGTYYLSYTWVDPDGHESGPGRSESLQFTVVKGAIPTATIAFPSAHSIGDGWTANLYLTAVNGTKGSEVLYATGIAATTYNLTYANTGTIAPPANAFCTDFLWADLSPSQKTLSLWNVFSGVQYPIASLPLVANPSVQATVNPIGGGATGGNLDAGTYFASYTWVDPNGVESGPGASESIAFTVAEGQIPSITAAFPYVLAPADGWTLNVYLTDAGGATGSETRYATGVKTATSNLAVAPPGGSPAPANIQPLATLQWYQLAMSLSATGVVTVQVYRTTDGFWLNNAGTWQPELAVAIKANVVARTGYAGFTLQSRADNVYVDDFYLTPYAVGSVVTVCAYFEFSGGNSRLVEPPAWFPVWCGGSQTWTLKPAAGYTCIGNCLLPTTMQLQISTSSPIGGGVATAGGGEWSGVGAPFDYGGSNNPPCVGALGAQFCCPTGTLISELGPYYAPQFSGSFSIGIGGGSGQAYNPPNAGAPSSSGGGTTGGNLAWGQYWTAFTWIDSVSGRETGLGASTSPVPVLVYPGWIPRMVASLGEKGIVNATVDFAQSAVNIYVSLPYNSPSSSLFASRTLIDPIGGGTAAGKLAPGSYHVAYTWTDPITGLESGIGDSESIQFNVAAGYIPQITMSPIPWVSPINPRATVDPIGGGATGGNLKPGNYYAAYTIVWPNGFETTLSTTESAVFTVASGNIPRFSIAEAFPPGGATVNLYLTAANGAKGSEVLYATDLTSPTSPTTFDLTNDNTGTTTPAPSYPTWNVYLTPPNGPAGSEVLYAAGVKTATYLLAAAAPSGGTPPPPTHGGVGDLVLYQANLAQANSSLMPSAAPSVDPTAGGIAPPPDQLAPGDYLVAYSLIDASTGGESPISPEAALTVTVSGPPVFGTYIPVVTIPALPASAKSANIYLTAAGGVPGTESLYMQGNLGQTAFALDNGPSAGAGQFPETPLTFLYDLAQLNTGTSPPPPNVMAALQGWSIDARYCPALCNPAVFGGGTAAPLWVEQCSPGFSASASYTVRLPVNGVCPPDWLLNGGVGGQWSFTVTESSG